MGFRRAAEPGVNIPMFGGQPDRAFVRPAEPAGPHPFRPNTAAKHRILRLTCVECGEFEGDRSHV